METQGNPAPSIIHLILQEAKIIADAPVAIIFIIIVFGIGIFYVFKYLHKERIAVLETHIEFLKAQLQARDATDTLPAESIADTAPIVTANGPSMLDERSNIKPYNERWKKVSPLTLWQAAWLWVGQEPENRVPPTTEAYSAFRMLKMAAQNGELNIQEFGPSGRLDAWALVTRDELRIFAAVKNESPSFLLSDD